MSDIPDGAAAGPWMDGFHAAEDILQQDVRERQLFRHALEKIATCPGWINSNERAWRKCWPLPENIWLSDDPTRCYHGRLVIECEEMCHARIASRALQARP